MVLVFSCPDVTIMVNWSLKPKYLSVCEGKGVGGGGGGGAVYP